MNSTRLRAADLADEFRSISSDKRMEYVPAQAVHLLIAADMLDANDELLMRLNAEYRVRQNLAAENAKLRELVRDVVLLAGLNGCDVTKMQMHAHGGDWRTVWERMSELGVPGTGVDHD